MRVIVAAGGTAGHLFPGVAVAELLRDRRAEVLFVGRKGGPEEEIVRAAGFEFRGIAVRGRGPGIVTRRNAQAALQLSLSVLKCLRIFSSFKPNVVMGAGGYVSLAPVLAARAAGVPVVIHEQNAVPGLANRIARRFATRVGVSFPGTEHEFGPRAVLTGNPVRSQIAGMDVEAAKVEASDHFDLDRSRKTLLVFGGSQGALHLNRTAVAAYDHWRALPFQVLHLAGRGKAAEIESALSGLRREEDLLMWRVFDYSNRMDLAYASASLALCRSGASSIAELAAVGLPAVLVPLPISLDDDQKRNAEAACAAGGAKMVLQPDLTPEALGGLIPDIIFDDRLLEEMRESIRTLARPDAAVKLAHLVWEAARP